MNVSDYIKSDFLALFANNHRIDENSILSKYGKNMKMIFDNKFLEVVSIQQDNPEMELGYSVSVNLNRVNNKNRADFSFYASNDPSDQNIKYVNRYLDPNDTHSLTHHQVANEIDSVIKREKINFVPLREPIPTDKKPNPNIFTTACLDVLINKFSIKENSEYCRKIFNGDSIVYKYSRQLITFVISLILDDPDIVVKSKEKTNPRSKGIST